MPRDLIDHASYAERLSGLETALVAAQRECDAAVLAEMNGEAGEADVFNASANVQAIQARIEGLKRAREESKIAEAEETDRQAAEDRKAAIATVEAKGAEIEDAARDIQSKLDAFLGAFPAYLKLLDELGGLLLPLIRDENRLRLVRDAMSHRHEAPVVLGLLQAAQVPGMHHLIGMDPIDAMHSYKGTSIESLVRNRLQRIMTYAAPDLEMAATGEGDR